MMMKKLDTTLYFITDSTCVSEDRFLPVVEAACKGGATIIQLREKDKSTREYMQLAEAVHAITLRYGIPLIIDDRVDVALAIGAEGVHVGQSDMPVCMARKLMGEDKIVGVTQCKEQFFYVRLIRAIGSQTSYKQFIGVSLIFRPINICICSYLVVIFKIVFALTLCEFISCSIINRHTMHCQYGMCSSKNICV